MNWFHRMCALGVCLFAASGCRHGGSPEQRAEWVVSKVAKKLSLSAAQKTKLEEVKTAILEARADGRGDRKQAIAEIRSAILSDHLDAAKTKSAVEKHQELRHKRFERGFDIVFPKLAEFHASLSAEQKNKAVGWLDDVIEHFSQE